MTKACSSGTMCEQIRFRMGWKSPTERKANPELALSGKRCDTCKHYDLKEIPNRDGGASPNYSPYCRHPHAYGEFGHATRATAVCDKWEMKP